MDDERFLFEHFNWLSLVCRRFSRNRIPSIDVITCYLKSKWTFESNISIVSTSWWEKKETKTESTISSHQTPLLLLFLLFFQNSLRLHSRLFCIIFTCSVYMTIRFRHQAEKKDMKILDSFLFLSLVTFLLIVEAKKKCPDRSSCLDSGKSCRIFKDRVSIEWEWGMVTRRDKEERVESSFCCMFKISSSCEKSLQFQSWWKPL